MAPSNDLACPKRVTRWIVLQKARRHRTSRLRLLVSMQFQILFHSPSGVLFTFPSRYWFTIDHKIYLALEGGPPRFNQGFTCPDLLETTPIITSLAFAYETITLFGDPFQDLLLTKLFLLRRYQRLFTNTQLRCFDQINLTKDSETDVFMN